MTEGSQIRLHRQDCVVTHDAELVVGAQPSFALAEGETGVLRGPTQALALRARHHEEEQRAAKGLRGEDGFWRRSIHRPSIGAARATSRASRASRCWTYRH